MKKQLVLYIILQLILIHLFISCKKEAPTAFSESGVTEEGLSEEQAAVFDTAVAPYLGANQIVLPDGQLLSQFKSENQDWFSGLGKNDGLEGRSPEQIKKLLLGAFLERALQLTDRSAYHYASEGLDKPEQKGLAYVFGSDDIDNRNKPTKGACKEWLYGLDCSGFMLQLIHYAGLPMGDLDAEGLSNPLNWSQAFNAFTPTIGFKLEKVPVGSKPQSGDIIYWTKIAGDATKHIGMVLEDINGNLKAYVSNGAKEPASECIKNYGSSRGPTTVYLNSKDFFSTERAEWIVLRIIVPQTQKQEYEIGDAAFGGIIFYLHPSKRTGLVRSIDAIGKRIKWDSKNKENEAPHIGAVGREIGDGKSNTTKIVNALTKQYCAAGLCVDYNGGGYSDWFLPSEKEAEAMGITISGSLSCRNWTSTEAPIVTGQQSRAFLVKTCTGGASESVKYTEAYVIAVREFSY